jgi:hypothetical protein
VPGRDPDLTLTLPRQTALDVLWDIEAMVGNGATVSTAMHTLAARIQELVGYDEFHRHVGERTEPL